MATIIERPRRAGTWNEDGSRSYTREFLIREATAVDAAAVMLMVGVPKWGDWYLPTDQYARCIGVNPTMESGDPRTWNVVCSYSTKYPQPDSEDPNPLMRPAEIRISSVRIDRPMPKDVNGQPFQNTIGEPLQNPPRVVYTRTRIVITRFEPSFSYSTPSQYANTKSSASWYGIAAGKVGCEEITAENHWENNVEYAHVTYSMLVDPFGFDEEVLNVGTYYKDGSGNKRGVTTGDGSTGVPTTVPRKLAADGTLLADGAAPVFITFQVRQAVNYAALLL